MLTLVKKRAHSGASRLFTALLLAGVATFAAVQPSLAAYPERTIRIVVGFTAGGPTDVPVRYIAAKLSEAIGQPVIVENKPGAASMLAVRDMLAQPRDGYTLVSCTYFDPVNTKLFKHAGYKATDIAPITLIAKYDYAITVPNSSPVKTVADFVKLAKETPGKLNYGHLGLGSSQNLLAKQIEAAAGITMTGIPYKGAADAVRDIIADRLDLFFGPPVVVMPQYSGKQLRLIAVSGKNRLASAPEVPTLIESGVPVDAFGWIGLCAGAGTPQPVIDFLSSKLTPILKSADYQSFIDRSGSIPASTTPAEMQTVMDETLRDIAPLIERFDIRLD